ncbi:hypothetical protein JL108_06210 [Aeromicrobium sp. YIM 150415]|uniref:hypothetical protein n=1 Tax=Aeromicrobium sp. YIM 150415 TaxID=2803912 RepID=UPI00196253CD|nr:hypothetical protein [Aeromicrobium sp. YIM 150415]MBM9463038.1 hypothetical protein [Aeromicrobium sp. YIM 150415]
MSLIDPSSRWWNRGSTRRGAAYLCWTVAVLSAGFGAWDLGGAVGSTPAALSLIASTVSIPLLILGVFLYQFGVDSEEFEGRSLFMPLVGYFIALGAGMTGGQWQRAGDLSILGLVFVIAGVVALLSTEVIARKVRDGARLRARVQRSGVLAEGRVTRTHRYSLNYQDVTRVTIRFTDSAGQTRWTSQTVSGNLKTGDAVRLKYSQADLGRRSAVVIIGR